MAEKTSGGTRGEILKAAKRMFFEKGFDGVTIRAIQREVGCEVGLFYYYFKSKEQIFDVVMDEKEKEWKEAFEGELQGAEDSLGESLETMVDVTFGLLEEFIGKESEKLHWSVKGAACNRIGKIAEDYVSQIMGSKKTEILTDSKMLSAVIAGSIIKTAESFLGSGSQQTKKELKKFLSHFLPEEQTKRDAGRREDISVVLL